MITPRRAAKEVDYHDPNPVDAAPCIPGPQVDEISEEFIQSFVQWREEQPAEYQKMMAEVQRIKDVMIEDEIQKRTKSVDVEHFDIEALREEIHRNYVPRSGDAPGQIDLWVVYDETSGTTTEIRIYDSPSRNPLLLSKIEKLADDLHQGSDFFRLAENVCIFARTLTHDNITVTSAICRDQEKWDALKARRAVIREKIKAEAMEYLDGATAKK